MSATAQAPGRDGGMPLVLYISPDSSSFDAPQLQALRETLNRQGIAASPSAIRHRQIANSDHDTTLAQARTVLAQERAKVIFSKSMLIARSVQEVDRSVPIVFAGAGDPVSLCLTDSLSKPGRNATGYTSYLPAEPKMIEALSDAFPQLQRVIILLDGTDAVSTGCLAGTPQWNASEVIRCAPGWLSDSQVRMLVEDRGLRQVLHQRSLAASVLRLCGPHDINRLARHASSMNVGVMVPFQYLFFEQATRLTATLAQLSLPAIYARTSFVKLGGSMSLSPSLPQNTSSGLQRGYEMVAQTLKGASPARLPVQTPSGFDLWINVGALHRMGLRPSLAILRRADHLLD